MEFEGAKRDMRTSGSDRPIRCCWAHRNGSNVLCPMTFQPRLIPFGYRSEIVVPVVAADRDRFWGGGECGKSEIMASFIALGFKQSSRCSRKQIMVGERLVILSSAGAACRCQVAMANKRRICYSRACGSPNVHRCCPGCSRR